MEPFAIVTINNEYVAAPPSQTNGCMAGALTVFVLPHDFQAGHNVCHRQSPCAWLLDLIAVQLVVKPRKNVLVAQPISHNKRQVSSAGVWQVAIRAGATRIAISCSSKMPASDGLATLKGVARTGTTTSSQGPKSGRGCYVTPTFLGVPKQRDKIKSGSLTPAFLGAHKRAEVLCKPYILGGPQTRGQNHKWLPHPCLLGGPQVGGSAT